MNAKMIRMRHLLGVFTTRAFIVWTVLAVAGYFYSTQQQIPALVAAVAVAAILVEAAFYLLPAFEALCGRLRGLAPRPALALLLALSAVLPYAVYSVPSGKFEWSSLALLFMLFLLVSCWFLLLPRRPLVDLSFLALVAGVILLKVFATLYARPIPELRMEALGDLTWRRVAILSIVLFRPQEGVGFGFLPRRQDWTEGLKHYFFFLPAGAALALALGFVRFRPLGGAWWEVAGLVVVIFLGMLWVVALTEEFFFRGLLQQWLSRWLSSPARGLVATSIIFGLVHLPFREFPNWKFALLAAVAGYFYGRAYQKTGSIRAAMVTHALVNTTWRALFV